MCPTHIELVSGSERERMRVRQATHAGSWYSLEQSELDTQLTGRVLVRSRPADCAWGLTAVWADQSGWETRQLQTNTDVIQRSERSLPRTLDFGASAGC